MASKKKRHSTFLGPVGKDVQVEFVAHALGRLIERFTPGGPQRPDFSARAFEGYDFATRNRILKQAIDAGLAYDTYCDGLRNPNAGRPDEVSSANYGTSGETRYCRWFRPLIDGQRVTCMAAFIVGQPATPSFPGSILVVTVFDPSKR